MWVCLTLLRAQHKTGLETTSLLLSEHTPDDVCVSNTRMRVSNTRVGVSNTRVGVSNTLLGVSDTRSTRRGSRPRRSCSRSTPRTMGGSHQVSLSPPLASSKPPINAPNKLLVR